MSGIVGVWNLDGRPVERALLARLSGTMAYRGRDGEGLWVAGPVGLGCQLLRVTPESCRESQPLVGENGIALVFDGRLDNRDELFQALEVSVPLARDCPDPDLILAAYHQYGESLPERLAGDFALAIFDPGRRHLLLARDPIGLRPLYYYRTGNTLLFASEIKAILAHPDVRTQPDEDIVAEYISMRFLFYEPEGRTFFKDIFSVRPAHMALFTQQGFSKRCYWDFDLTQSIRLGSIEEYAEAFRAHFERAVARRLRSAGPVAITVSGGLDSSSIFCMAETLRRRQNFPALRGMNARYREGSESDEREFVQSVERKYRVEISTFSFTPLEAVQACRDSVFESEMPFLDQEFHGFAAMGKTLEMLGSRTLLMGTWGDQMLSTYDYLFDLARRLQWRDFLVHSKGYKGVELLKEMLRFAVRHWAPEQLVSMSRRRRARSSRGLQHSHLPAAQLPYYSSSFWERVQRVASGPTTLQVALRKRHKTAHGLALYCQVRLRHHVVGMEWLTKVTAPQGIEVSCPFLDRDLVAFLIAIPGEVASWNGVQKGLLRQAMRGILPDEIADRRSSAVFTQEANDRLEADLDRLLDSLCAAGVAVELGYVNRSLSRAEIAEIKKNLRGSTAERAAGLRDFLALNCWLETFFSPAPRLLLPQ